MKCVVLQHGFSYTGSLTNFFCTGEHNVIIWIYYHKVKCNQRHFAVDFCETVEYSKENAPNKQVTYKETGKL